MKDNLANIYIYFFLISEKGKIFERAQCPAVQRMMYLQFSKTENKQAKKSVKMCIALLRIQFGRYF